MLSLQHKLEADVHKATKRNLEVTNAVCVSLFSARHLDKSTVQVFY